MRVYIAVCSCRDWKPQFGASLCGLVRRMVQDGVDFTLNCMTGTSVLPKARQLAIEHALQEGYTHILFLDDDMAFDNELFSMLSAHNLAVVAANYTNKNPLQQNPQTHNIDGTPLSSCRKTGIEEAGWIGFGAVLIDLSIMDNIPKPWFEMRYIQERQSFIGEDYFFCAQARSAGHKIYVCHDVKCAHVGDYPYKEL